MVKRYFIALLIFLSTFGVHAQDRRTIDSLKSVIEDAKNDTSVCEAYLLFGEQVYLSNLDTALILWQNAHDIAKKNLAASPTTSLKKKHLFFLAEALNNIGYIYGEKGDIQKQAEYYHKSLKIKEEIGNKKGVAESLNNIGYLCNNEGDVAKGLEYFHKSLNILEEIGDKNGVGLSLNNIGSVYYHQGDVAKGLEYLHKSLKIREETGDKNGVAASLNNIGTIYDDQGDISKGLEYYHKSLKIQEEIDDKNGVAVSLNNIGYIHENQGDYSRGLEYYHKSIKIYEEIGDKQGMAMSLHNLGNTYLKQGVVGLAKQHAKKSMELAKEVNFPRNIRDAAGLLRTIAKTQNNYKEALEMYELHIQMRDSINNESTQKATIHQQTKYEFEKAQLVKEQKEKEQAHLEAEVTDRRDNLQHSVILIAILTLFGGVLALGFINVSERMAEGIIFFSFLILFEFLLVLADPYVENWSSGAPGIKLLFNAGIAALIFPAHAFFESKLKGRLVKNQTR